MANGFRRATASGIVENGDIAIIGNRRCGGCLANRRRARVEAPLFLGAIAMSAAHALLQAGEAWSKKQRAKQQNRRRTHRGTQYSIINPGQD